MEKYEINSTERKIVSTALLCLMKFQIFRMSAVTVYM